MGYRARVSEPLGGRVGTGDTAAPMNRVEVELDGKVVHVTAGTRVSALLGAGLIEDRQIVAALVNHHVVGLQTRVEGPVTVEPLPRSDARGSAVIRRAATLALHAVAAKEFPHLRFSVGQSLHGGHFYEVQTAGDEIVDLEELAEVLSAGVAAVASADEVIEREELTYQAARAALNGHNRDIEGLLKAWIAPLIPTVRLGDLTSLALGPYPPSTGVLDGTLVVAYPPGLLLRFPDLPASSATSGSGALWESYRQTRDWNRLIGVETVGALNEAVLGASSGNLIRVSEALHEKRIAQVADAVAQRHDQVRLVCLAGPTSSGKTTTVRRLSIQLRVNGIEPVVLGLDDYYRDRDSLVPDEHGEVDLEQLDALDVPLLQDHLQRLVDGDAVDVPRFDFETHARAPRSAERRLQLGEHQVLLIEGIHALNPRLTDAVDADASFRLFVSANSQLVVDDHHRISSTDLRMLRRIVRDRRFRATSAASTIARWPSVRRGEEAHIFPFEDTADFVFNSSLPYEPSVLRTFAWRYLLEVPRDDPARSRAHELLKLLELFIPLFPDHVPSNSVLREFIGGSAFRY